ncbi:hypothetical protein OYC64_019629 [Pagothenia borchgrevinki]|uniref:SOSS complex subunit C n=1 Tax=Pagothenia borchgrevinki TaxID=8213 RepID=A0ABD2FIF5_PAGBO
MATNPPGQAFPNKARVAILAELEKERRRLLNTPGASISLSRPNLKEFRDNAEQQHIAAQQKAALQHAHTHSSGFFITQDSSFGNLILPVIPRLEPRVLTFLPLVLFLLLPVGQGFQTTHTHVRPTSLPVPLF